MSWTSEAVERACEQIEVLRGPRTVEALPGGLTNHNVKVTTERGAYVLRFDQADTDLLGIDREAEAHDTRAAEASGVGPPFVDFRADLHVLVVGFVEARTLDNETFAAEPGLVPRVAHACRRLHAGPRFRRDQSMFERHAGFWRLLRERGYAHPDDYGDHLADFERVRRALAAHPEPTAPCNNDSLAENFLDDGQKIWIIDYEYASNNEPSFELGNVATECGLTVEQADRLALAYYDVDAGSEQGRSAVARVRLQATVARYGWALWGYLQAATSGDDFDYRSWGDERFEKARRDFTADDFEDRLDRAAAAPAPPVPPVPAHDPDDPSDPSDQTPGATP